MFFFHCKHNRRNMKTWIWVGGLWFLIDVCYQLLLVFTYPPVRSGWRSAIQGEVSEECCRPWFLQDLIGYNLIRLLVCCTCLLGCVISLVTITNDALYCRNRGCSDSDLYQCRVWFFAPASHSCAQGEPEANIPEYSWRGNWMMHRHTEDRRWSKVRNLEIHRS